MSWSLFKCRSTLSSWLEMPLRDKIVFSLCFWVSRCARTLYEMACLDETNCSILFLSCSTLILCIRSILVLWFICPFLIKPGCHLSSASCYPSVIGEFSCEHVRTGKIAFEGRTSLDEIEIILLAIGYCLFVFCISLSFLFLRTRSFRS